MIITTLDNYCQSFIVACTLKNVEKEAVLYERLPNHKVRCLACARYCEIGKDQIGLCGIRGNKEGKLVLFVYGKVAACHIDPIEKKPVTHYMPGTKVFSIGTTGCNWLCKYCINFDLSQRRKVEGADISPEEVVEKALLYRCQGIAYTYNEPSIFLEYARDCGVLARKKGLFNAFVSNGFATPESIKMMNEFLDCITVDFKGNGEQKFVRQYVGIPTYCLTNFCSPFPLKSTVMQSRNSFIILTDSGVAKPLDTKALKSPFFLARTPQSRAYSRKILGSLYVYAMP